MSNPVSSLKSGKTHSQIFISSFEGPEATEDPVEASEDMVAMSDLSVEVTVEDIGAKRV